MMQSTRARTGYQKSKREAGKGASSKWQVSKRQACKLVRWELQTEKQILCSESFSVLFFVLVLRVALEEFGSEGEKMPLFVQKSGISVCMQTLIIISQR